MEKKYSSNRNQRVVTNYSNSQWRDVKSWEPSGFNTGSSLIYNLQSSIKLFADDTSLYLIVDDPNETADSLNLTKIHDWTSKRLVTFAKKTETITIYTKIDKPDDLPLYMNNNDISTLSEQRHLVLVI